MGKKLKEKTRKSISVVLVHSHELERHGLRGMVSLEEDMEVVGEYGNFEEALPQLPKLSPDIVLMGMELPGMNGIEATRHLKKEGVHCDADIIVLGQSGDGLVQALEAGAAGYLLKDIKRAELAQAIREVYHNRPAAQEAEGKRGVSVEEGVDLVVPRSVKPARLAKFAADVEKTLEAHIVCTVGSWDWGTAITIQTPKPMLLANLVDRLKDMPQVEEAEEPRVRNGLPGILRKITVPGSETSPRKRVLVSLK